MTIPANTRMFYYTIKIYDDDLFESNETFSINIDRIDGSMGSRVNRNDPYTTKIIIEDDEHRE